MNKKGNIDIAWILLGTFITVILVFVGILIWNSAHPNLERYIDDSSLSQADKDRNAELYSNIDSMLGIGDYIIAFLLILSIITVIISAMFIRTHPVWIVTFVVSLIITFVLALVLSNSFEIFQSVEGMDDVTVDYSITTTFMDLLPKIFWPLMMAIGIAIYSKTRGGRVI